MIQNENKTQNNSAQSKASVNMVDEQREKTSKNPANWVMVMALYLLGIFMGAIDTGIVTPARTVIQNNLGISETVGIWMITIYTLSYAAAIPVMGKLADRFGKKRLYVISIVLFGIGSFGCGLAQNLASFPLLLFSRVVQAIGGGGIVPIATAAIGTIVPKSKQGMALGLVGGVYGVANVFGASAGSAILDIVGIDNWQWIFYINVPIAVFVIVFGIRSLPADAPSAAKKIDYAGITLMVAIVLALLWVFQHLDFFDLIKSVQDPNVWAASLAVIVFTPIFIICELKADDPVIDIRYFAKFQVALTMLLAALSGMTMMAIIFVPQFAENSMRLAAGAGGYPVIILGLASGVGAPLSGKLTDKYGPRLVIGFGALVSVIAALALIYWASPNPGYFSAIVCLILMGLGLGFIIGAPLNYLILHLLPASQATSGLANLSLVRAFGTTIAPAILVGLLANSLSGLQNTLMDELPDTVSIGELPHAQELQNRFAALKADPRMAEVIGDFAIPDFTQTTFPVKMSTVNAGKAATDNGIVLPDQLISLLQTADVTNIVARSIQVSDYIFEQQLPTQIAQIQAGIAKGIHEISNGQKQIDARIVQLKSTGAPAPVIAQLENSRNETAQTIIWMEELSAALPDAFTVGQKNYAADIRENSAELESTFQLALNRGFANLFWFYGLASLAMLILLIGVPGKKK
ncbi:MFS transporter [Arcanobacterium hippocoleae]|uniref:MFS transporter n=1 Tax=Arcanobacterium hippocoleae TaxID=149017 RepID=UPI0033406759